MKSSEFLPELIKLKNFRDIEISDIKVDSREVNEGDIFFAYSTSGNSENIVCALESAKEKKVVSLGFSGNDGGKMSELCDICFIVPDNNTALIQEIHSALGHEICSAVEKELFFSNS